MIAVAEGDTPAQVLKTIPFDQPRLLREFRKLGQSADLKVCYEAGPTGFGLQRSNASAGRHHQDGQPACPSVPDGGGLALLQQHAGSECRIAERREGIAPEIIAIADVDTPHTLN